MGGFHPESQEVLLYKVLINKHLMNGAFVPARALLPIFLGRLPGDEKGFST
ncbi:MAG TPA: hypothetical protein VMW81_01380 [Nitrospinota bacterium]|nr:hypothetical protein [Nitrospinota bacterium]